jgi:hypothetical protein
LTAARWPLSWLALKAVLLCWAVLAGWWLVEAVVIVPGAAVCPWCGALLGDEGR